MRSGKGGKFRGRRLVLRLPVSARPDRHQHHGRNFETASRQGSIPNYLREAFQEAKAEFGGRGPRLADVMGLLRIAIASLPQVFICIDALDECLPKCLPELLESLRNLVRESPNTRIFLTGRPHVAEAVGRYFAKTVVIPISPNTEDIRNYVEMRLDRDDEPEAMTNDLRGDIVAAILEKISDMCVAFPLN